MTQTGWTKPSARSRLLPIAAVVVLIAIGLVAAGSVSMPGVSPTSTALAPLPGAPGQGLLAEYGGSASVYAEIASETNCAALQETFDRAGDNNDTAAPGTPEHKWTLGYMKASDDRMRAIGCY